MVVSTLIITLVHTHSEVPQIFTCSILYTVSGIYSVIGVYFRFERYIGYYKT